MTVETKPASVALHVRNASPGRRRGRVGCGRAASDHWDAHATDGKAVLEFAVISTDKGEAVDILRDRHDATAVVFFGDDVTDEKAFRRLRDADIGVKVGPGDTPCRFPGRRAGRRRDRAAHLLERAAEESGRRA